MIRLFYKWTISKLFQGMTNLVIFFVYSSHPHSLISSFVKDDTFYLGLLWASISNSAG